MTFTQWTKDLQETVHKINEALLCDNCKEDVADEDSGLNHMCKYCWSTAQVIYQEEANRI